MRLAIRVGVGLLGLLLLAGLGLYVASEAVYRHRVEVPLIPIVAATDPGAVARGDHLSKIYGCSGCHGKNLQGELWSENPMLAKLYTTNLTRVLPNYTDAQIVRAVRGGVRADGSALWSMPSESWIDVTDAEMADLIAFLRSVPVGGEPTPRVWLGPIGRIGLLTKEFQASTVYVDEARSKPSFDAGPAFARGRHLAATVCSECHRSDLKGDGMGSPDLLIAASYDLPLFTRLMRTGIGMDGKEHGLMTEVARSRFVHLTDQDVADLHGYFTARAERMD